jgi:hypothetical protein
MPSGKRLWIIVAAVVLIPIAGIAWWLGSPLLFDDVVNEEFPLSSSATVPEDTTREEVEKVMEVIARVEDEADEPMPKEMADTGALKTGNFRDADRFHKGEGQATIHVLEDGARVLRLEDFRVTNGPSLRVILATTADPSSSAEVLQGAYVDLGTLKGNVGSQNYPIPDDTDLSAINSIVIYCKPFKVVFSVATLE